MTNKHRKNEFCKLKRPQFCPMGTFAKLSILPSTFVKTCIIYMAKADGIRSGMHELQIKACASCEVGPMIAKGVDPVGLVSDTQWIESVQLIDDTISITYKSGTAKPARNNEHIRKISMDTLRRIKRVIVNEVDKLTGPDKQDLLLFCVKTIATFNATNADVCKSDTAKPARNSKCKSDTAKPARNSKCKSDTAKPARKYRKGSLRNDARIIAIVAKGLSEKARPDTICERANVSISTVRRIMKDLEDTAK